MDEVSQEIPDKSPKESHFDEQNLRDAIEKWVSDKQYVKNDQTVEEIAYELGTTHTVLKWYFTNRMHTTFRTWRISLRIQEAKRLMREEKVAAWQTRATSTNSFAKLLALHLKSMQKELWGTSNDYSPSIKANHRENRGIPAFSLEYHIFFVVFRLSY